MSSDEELRRRARKTAKEKVGFYIHLSIYAIVNSLLIAVWWFTGGVNMFPWFIFILGFWGIGVVAHGIGTFRGPAYVDRMAEEEYRKLKREEQERQEQPQTANA